MRGPPWKRSSATRRTPYRRCAGCASACPPTEGAAPSLWINPPGGDGLSSEIEEFIPERLRWAVPPGRGCRKTTKYAEEGGSELPSNRRTARWPMKPIPPGRFRAADVRRIVERHYPADPAAQPADACGSFLAQQLLPLLESTLEMIPAGHPQSKIHELPPPPGKIVRGACSRGRRVGDLPPVRCETGRRSKRCRTATK